MNSWLPSPPRTRAHTRGARRGELGELMLDGGSRLVMDACGFLSAIQSSMDLRTPATVNNEEVTVNREQMTSHQSVHPRPVLDDTVGANPLIVSSFHLAASLRMRSVSPGGEPLSEKTQNAFARPR